MSQKRPSVYPSSQPRKEPRKVTLRMNSNSLTENSRDNDDDDAQGVDDDDSRVTTSTSSSTSSNSSSANSSSSTSAAEWPPDCTSRRLYGHSMIGDDEDYEILAADALRSYEEYLVSVAQTSAIHLCHRKALELNVGLGTLHNSLSSVLASLTDLRYVATSSLTDALSNALVQEKRTAEAMLDLKNETTTK